MSTAEVSNTVGTSLIRMVVCLWPSGLVSIAVGAVSVCQQFGVELALGFTRVLAFACQCAGVGGADVCARAVPREETVRAGLEADPRG